MKVNTGSQSIANQIEELLFFKAIQLIRLEKNPKTGRPSTSVILTSFGKSLLD